MNVCSRTECQTSAGCKCGEIRPVFKSLADFTDDEIAREYHLRMLRKLGDPRIGVSLPLKATW